MRHVLALAVLLSACVEPRAGCLSRANAELEALDYDIAESATAIDRGYRVRDGSSVRAGLSVCASDSPIKVCISGDGPVSERRIAVDRGAERARLRALEARRPAVAAAADRAAAACAAP